MTATLTAPAEALLREQVASGQFSSMDFAVEAAIQTVFGLAPARRLNPCSMKPFSIPDDVCRSRNCGGSRHEGRCL